MTAIGADPEALLELSRRFRKLRIQLEASRSELDRHLRNINWHGPDAERLRRSWSLQHRVSLLRSAELCQVSTTHLLRQVEEQRWASDAMEASGGGASGSGGASGGGAGASGGGGAAISADRVDVPDSIATVNAGASLTIASVLLGVTHDIRIETFADGSSLVTFTSLGRAGTKGSVGASVNLGPQQALGASASAEASLGGVLRRSYRVPTSDVAKLIATVELQAAAIAVSSSAPAGAARAVLGAAGSIGGWLTGKMPTSAKDLLATVDPRRYLPAPVSTERLVQFDASADSSLSSIPVVGPSAMIGAGFTVRAGRIEGSGGAASVFEAEGSIAAELRARFIGEFDREIGGTGDASGRPSLRIQIPDASSDASPRGPMVITSTATSGDTVRRTTSTVDLTRLVGIDLAERTRLVFQNLAADDPGGAFRELTHMRVPEDAVVTTVATFSRGDYSGAIGGEAGEGVSIGADFEGGLRRLSRTG